MIEVEGLTKDYGPRRAINNLTFNANPGEILGFLGPNGAGKTTTIKMIVGLLRPDSGDVVVCGQHVGSNGLAANGGMYKTLTIAP